MKTKSWFGMPQARQIKYERMEFNMIETKVDYQRSTGYAVEMYKRVVKYRSHVESKKESLLSQYDYNEETERTQLINFGSEVGGEERWDLETAKK